MPILLFFLVFAPYVILFGYPIPIGYLAYLLVFFLYFLRKNGDLRYLARDPVFLAITLFSTYCAFSLFFNTLRQGELDTKLLRLVIDPYVIYFSSRYIFFRVIGRSEEKGVNQLINVLTALNILNASVIYLSFVSESFNAVFYGVVQVNSKIFDYPIPRFSGFLYDGFSYASTLMSLITITCFNLYTNIQRKSGFVLIFLHAFTLPASLLAGRTGIVILFIYFAFVFFFRANKLFKLLIKPRRLILLSGVVLILGSLIYFVYGIDGPIGEYFRHATRFITDLFDDRGYSESTTSELAENHFFFPIDTLSLFIGSGYLADWPDGSKRPDPAITLGIFAFGLIGLVFFLGVLISPLVRIFRSKSRSFPLEQQFGLMLVFVVLLFKDAYIFYPYPHFFIFFLCSLFACRAKFVYA